MEDKQQIQNVTAGQEEEENPLAKLDFRVIYLDIVKHLWIFLLIFIVVVICVGAGMITFSRTSEKRWSASTQLFHQSMSEKIPMFYKQVSTRVVMELTKGNGVFDRVVEKLKLPKSQAPLIRKQITVEIPRDQPNIIIITAHNNNAQLAADIVNAIADASLSAYVDMQNSTLKNIVEDRRKRRLVLQGQLVALENSLASYAASDSYLMPDKDMERLSAEIIYNMNEISRIEMDIIKFEKKNHDLDKILSEMPDKIVETEKLTRPKEYSLVEEETALAIVRKRYTENHPERMRKEMEYAIHKQMIEDEIKNFQPASEIFTSINFSKEDMKVVRINNNLELESSKVALETHRKGLEDLRAKVKNRQVVLSAYNETMRNISGIRLGISELDVAINDSETLLNTAVPDLSILNYAVPSSHPRTNRKLIVVVSGAAGAACSGGLMVLFLVIGVFFGPVKSPKDFMLLPSMVCLGMLPRKHETSEKELTAAFHQCYNRFQDERGEKRLIFLDELSPNSMLEVIKGRWKESFGASGKTVFWLSCYPVDDMESLKRPASYNSQAVDEELIAVEKFGNHGVFFSENPLVLNTTELELLKADLSVLKGVYDIIVIERGVHGKTSDSIFVQLSALAGYAVLLTSFGVEPKAWLKTIAGDDSLSECQFGGILTNVPRKYWKMLKD